MLRIFGFIACALSPDSRKLFAICTQERGGAELVRYDSGLKEFVPYLQGIPANWASFSKDGRWVAYLKFRKDTRMRPDGSDARQLTFPPLDVAGLDWSPDGKQIAVRAKKPGNPYKIYLISAAGGEPQELWPQHREEEGIPTWCSDGKQIAFGNVPVLFGHAIGNEVIHLYDLRTRRLSSLPVPKVVDKPVVCGRALHRSALTIAKQGRPFKRTQNSGSRLPDYGRNSSIMILSRSTGMKAISCL